jgi:excisionase family DNA binding protein
VNSTPIERRKSAYPRERKQTTVTPSERGGASTKGREWDANDEKAGRDGNESRQRVPDNALLVTVDQAAEMLSLGRVTVYRLIREGKLEVRHFGRATRITRKSIEKLVDA